MVQREVKKKKKGVVYLSVFTGGLLMLSTAMLWRTVSETAAGVVILVFNFW